MLTNNTVSGSISSGSGGDEHSSIVTAATLIDGACTTVVGGVVNWTSIDNNIESPGDTCSFVQSTDQVNVSAARLNLGPLQQNGGLTETHALLPDSVAIDWIPQLDCQVDTDQRGERRPETGGTMCDVGSFEVQP
jgi:hypothetical protein